MRVSFFGSSLVSAYWNGAATYYRGILGALAARGHQITFYEPDAYDRQRHRDMPDPSWARVVVYANRLSAACEALAGAAGSDLVVKASGVGVFDEWLEENVLSLADEQTRVAFWDVDAPATLERVAARADDPFRRLVPAYDIVFTYGGGPPVVAGYQALGARRCVPIYNAVDPATHHPAAPDPRFAGDLGLLANRLPDREARIDEFFFSAAARLPGRQFVLGGNGWEGKTLPANVRAVGHVYTRDHNAFNTSVGVVLNVNRDSMARFGYSPATRVFEAAGAGACLLTDAFTGLELFLTPPQEILTARDGAEVAEVLAGLDRDRARRIGERARARVLAGHTYAHRARDVEQALAAWPARTPLPIAAGRSA
jgi:spore maturation protein CgeB